MPKVSAAGQFCCLIAADPWVVADGVLSNYAPRSTQIKKAELVQRKEDIIMIIEALFCGL